MELQEGKTGTTKDGRRVIVKGGRIVYMDAPVVKGGAQPNFFEKERLKAAAKVSNESEEMAGGALSRIEEGAQYIDAIQNKKLPTGITIPTRAKLGLFSDQQKLANVRSLDRFAGTAAMNDASKLKPLSNSDMAFLMKLQAGSGESSQTNLDFLRARQWVDNMQLGYAAARNAWTSKLGSPIASNKQGMNFDAWWSMNANKYYPRPKLGEKGSYSAPKKASPLNQAKKPPRILSIEQVK